LCFGQGGSDFGSRLVCRLSDKSSVSLFHE
jgi:hypothetical protein